MKDTAQLALITQIGDIINEMASQREPENFRITQEGKGEPNCFGRTRKTQADR
jgi:hypothetical protein